MGFFSSFQIICVKFTIEILQYSNVELYLVVKQTPELVFTAGWNLACGSADS